ncbi:probable ATP-dependent RNA helicase DDX53 [Diadema antillarum]|uniref:probable ATP-dependent RNA helicase DDX53 n=1 Tax=Diadema antillarum TaxID=105358 RepID=UPI003A844D68
MEAEYLKEKWKNYPKIIKDFFIEHSDIKFMTDQEADAFKKVIGVTTVDESAEELKRVMPKPVKTFEKAFQEYPEILKEIYKQKFTKPSPIQSQGWPVAFQGHDLLGIAQTKSGKTLAFLLPALTHTDLQPVPRKKRGGPNVLVLSPTRELSPREKQPRFSTCKNTPFPGTPGPTGVPRGSGSPNWTAPRAQGKSHCQRTTNYPIISPQIIQII